MKRNNCQLSWKILEFNLEIEWVSNPECWNLETEIGLIFAFYRLWNILVFIEIIS